MTTLTEIEADAFAGAWMDAWNSHDAERIAAHYHADVEYHSPFLVPLTGGGVLRGRVALRDYITAALAKYPDLHFGPQRYVGAGSDSVAIVYRSVEDLLAIETLVLDRNLVAVRVHCHYQPLASVRAGDWARPA